MMGDDSGIEWTDATWNPTRGCSLVSPGCENCYAMKQAHRMSGPGAAYEGLTRLGKHGPTWTGDMRIAPEKSLFAPLRWTKPRRIFVDSMSDLFHEKVTNEEIAAVFAIMAACPKHTFQVLTKRAERMHMWFEWAWHHRQSLRAYGRDALLDRHPEFSDKEFDKMNHGSLRWPLPNVWLGVSVENQKCADWRIPLLLSTPAFVRFLSAEPLLEKLDLGRWLIPKHSACQTDATTDESKKALASIVRAAARLAGVPLLHWVIVGGESGPSARPFHVAWARSLVEQCEAAGVACFVKQVGKQPIADDRYDMSEEMFRELDASENGYTEAMGSIVLELKDKHGGDMTEWPLDIRVREFPAVPA